MKFRKSKKKRKKPKNKKYKLSTFINSICNYMKISEEAQPLTSNNYGDYKKRTKKCIICDIKGIIPLIIIFILLSITLILIIRIFNKNTMIKTKWGKNLDKNNIWQEYPRPQLERKDWLNLNGYW